MNVRINATMLLGLLAISRAEAAPIYTTTDLGPGYQLQADAGGQAYDLANADGSAVYAFDKSPVNSINVQTVHADGTFQLLTMQDGTHQVGYNTGLSSQAGTIIFPTFSGINMGWFIQGGLLSTSPPVADINSLGQFVGTSQYAPGQTSPGQTSTYAAFSDPTGQAHGSGSIVNNLNNYIATIPGVSLTSAVKIDDLGRIIAVGSDGNDYLLTPVALGAASPVPEPTTVVTLGLLASLLGFRSIRRRRQR